MFIVVEYRLNGSVFKSWNKLFHMPLILYGKA